MTNLLNPCRARIVLGVDIGSSGALALLTGGGDLVFVADMPTLDDGPAGRPAVNAPLLASILRQWGPTDAYVEFVGARPGEAPSGAFAFGRSRGVVEGVLGTMGVLSKLLTPPTWKRAVGIKPGKDGAKDAARSESLFDQIVIELRCRFKWRRRCGQLRRVIDTEMMAGAIRAI